MNQSLESNSTVSAALKASTLTANCHNFSWGYLSGWPNSDRKSSLKNWAEEGTSFAQLCLRQNSLRCASSFKGILSSCIWRKLTHGGLSHLLRKNWGCRSFCCRELCCKRAGHGHRGLASSMGCCNHMHHRSWRGIEGRGLLPCYDFAAARSTCAYYGDLTPGLSFDNGHLYQTSFSGRGL